MKNLIIILITSLLLCSCGSSQDVFYSEKVDIEIYENNNTIQFKGALIVNAEDGLIVFTHNMKSYYFTCEYLIK